MRVAIGVALLFVAIAFAVETPSVNNGVYDYHRKFGIPEAQKIKAKEDGILSGRVAGGSSTTLLSVPYQAGLIMTVLIWSSVCSAAIISANSILTAAHCYNDGNSIAGSVTVVVGSNFLFTGGTRITDTNVITHPEYNPLIAANDIAVIKVPTITLTTFAQAINLPLSTQLGNTFEGVTALASGFGVSNEDDTIGLFQGISSVNLVVISNEECEKSYPGYIQRTHLCTSGAGGVGMCGGDTGGPLVAVVSFRRTLIGISSFISAAGCTAGNPSGFTRVSTFLPWISSVM